MPTLLLDYLESTADQCEKCGLHRGIQDGINNSSFSRSFHGTAVSLRANRTDMQLDYYCILVNFIFVSSYFYKCIPIYYYTLTLS